MPLERYQNGTGSGVLVVPNVNAGESRVSQEIATRFNTRLPKSTLIQFNDVIENPGVLKNKSMIVGIGGDLTHATLVKLAHGVNPQVLYLAADGGTFATFSGILGLKRWPRIRPDTYTDHLADDMSSGRMHVIKIKPGRAMGDLKPALENIEIPHQTGDFLFTAGKGALADRLWRIELVPRKSEEQRLKRIIQLLKQYGVSIKNSAPFSVKLGRSTYEVLDANILKQPLNQIGFLSLPHHDKDVLLAILNNDKVVLINRLVLDMLLNILHLPYLAHSFQVLPIEENQNIIFPDKQDETGNNLIHIDSLPFYNKGQFSALPSPSPTSTDYKLLTRRSPKFKRDEVIFSNDRS